MWIVPQQILHQGRGQMWKSNNVHRLTTKHLYQKWFQGDHKRIICAKIVNNFQG